MNSDFKPLAVRREELRALCAQQRGELVEQCQALRMPFDGGLRGVFAKRTTLTLALAGAAIGLIAVRPKKMLSLAAAGLSIWKMARNVLPMLARSSSEGD